MIFAADPKADIQAPRVFGVPPGVDFPAALVAGLNARSDAARPEMLAHATVYLNTRRMHRRCQTLFEAGPPRLLPRLKLLSVVAPPWDQALPPARDKLTRQLDLTTLISRLIEAAPDLAPPAAAFDLAGSLAALLDEAQGEGVALDKILGLNVADASGHWQRSLQFLRIIAGMEGGEALDPEALQRRKIQALAQYWASFPEERPVIIAGSTGSRGTTALLMQAVARLPQGAIILPGYDFDMDDTQWRRLTHPDAIEDHPQYRFAALLQDLGIGPQDVQPWTDDLAPNPARNRLISLSLCPAPVTDRWLLDGPALGDLRQASDGLSLISAPDAPREALAIALAMRDAVERGKSVALISPDRMLTRRVAAALDRWRITADDSAGEPLAQTAVGRLLRHVAELMGAQTSSEALLVLLKHPACHQGAGRGDHLRLTRDLELHLRRKAVAFPGQADLTRALGDDAAATAWIRWICQILDQLRAAESGSLAELTATLTSTAEALAMGSDPQGELKLWDGKDGSEAHKQLTALSAAAENHPDLQSAFDFRMILRGLLSGEVRDPLASRPDVMIWGTLEARVHGADLVILGGLNEGIWPEQPNPDPWLNRQMRREAGLLSPERRVGLSAHDYQQAVCSGEVILSRAARDAEAETVPSRWLNRLLNLLGGLPDQHGDAALAAMQARGTVWTDLAAQQDRPAHRLPPSPRPAPAPPAQARPRNYRATEIETLIRDPYQIYARKILKLHPLDGLRQRPEARLRGTLFHEVLETFLPLYPDLPENAQQEALLDIAAQILA
ncbi:MAG: double-strand break repair protein AddB, partial [Mangrovicoccus sp.]